MTIFFGYEKDNKNRAKINPLRAQAMRRKEIIQDIFNVVICFCSGFTLLALLIGYSTFCVMLGVFAGNFFNLSPILFIFLIFTVGAYNFAMIVIKSMDWFYCKMDHNVYQ